MISLFQNDQGVVAALISLHVGTIGPYNSLARMIRFNGTPQVGTGGWPGANRALYVPIFMPARFTVARFLADNNNATGNVDLGIYDYNGNRKLSTGSTARSGAPAVQYVPVADQSFPSGTYYLAQVCSSTSSSILRSTIAATYAAACGVLQEDLGATTLPATMTPVAFTGTYIPLWGFTQSDTL